jgi:hypothetical protein
MEGFLKKYGVLILILFLAWKAFDQYKEIGPDNQVLRADGKAYYAYLPAVFIYNDNQFGFIAYYEHKYYHPGAYADFRNKTDGVYVNKYFAGIAVLQLPFFLMAHGISLAFHLTADGYAPLYQQFFVLGGLFYLFLGMQFLFLYLLRLNAKAWQAIAGIVVLLFGTNTYHYAVYEQCMSHIYSLSMFCIFIYGVFRILHTQSRKWLVISFFVLGMIIVIRPVNALIILFIPFIAGAPGVISQGWRFMIHNFKYLAAAFFAACLPIIVQLLLWHWQTGKFVVYSYGNESIEWGNPKMWHILFGYRKGWFVWTPLAFIGVCSLFIFIKDWFRFLTVMLFLLVVIYVLSCWWTADYGMSFGAREFIEFLFIPVIGLTVLLQKIRYGVIKILLLTLCCIGIYVNQVQARQYRDHIILWDGMNKETYWRVFLETSPGYYYWIEERNGFKKPQFISIGIDKRYLNDFEQPYGWEGEKNVSEKWVHSGVKANFIDKNLRKSVIFNHMLTKEEINHDSIIQAGVWFYGPQPDFTSLVIQFERNGKEISKNDVRIRKFADENYQWNQAILQSVIPAEAAPGTIIKVYVDNLHNDDTFYLDDFSVDMIKK